MVVLITGASSGFGQLLARTLRGRGHTVFGTSRNPETASAEAPLLRLDVRDDDSVAACLRQVEAAAGPVDVLVNNAGYLHEGPSEELTMDELRAIFETNFFGAVRMTNAVLPSMRARKRGHIVNVGSLAGVIPLPFMGGYSATKRAIDSYSESLYHELKPLGIRVSVVEAGYHSTGLATRKLRTTPSIADYDEQRARMYRTIAHDEVARSDDPAVVASLLTRIVEGKTTRLRHIFGSYWITYHLRGLVPERVWQMGFRLTMGLDRS
jgi:short-subunit dehydrogenase